MIPDSISHQALAALIANSDKLPASPVLPSLEFGADAGAPCNLQIAILALIQQSRSGVNLCQLVTALLFLLYNAESSFQQWHQRAVNGEPPFDHDDLQDREATAMAMAEFVAVAKAIAPALEDLNRALVGPLVARRIQQIGQRPEAEEQQGHFYSQLLVSDELLDDLSLTRDDVTQFLSAHI